MNEPLEAPDRPARSSNPSKCIGIPMQVSHYGPCRAARRQPRSGFLHGRSAERGSRSKKECGNIPPHPNHGCESREMGIGTLRGRQVLGVSVRPLGISKRGVWVGVVQVANRRDGASLVASSLQDSRERSSRRERVPPTTPIHPSGQGRLFAVHPKNRIPQRGSFPATGQAMAWETNLHGPPAAPSVHRLMERSPLSGR